MIAERRIETPRDLTEALRELRSAIEAGRLRQVWKQDALCGTEEAIHDIPDEGPWGDYLELYFLEPTTGHEFKLSAETYHGAGGSLEWVG